MTQPNRCCPHFSTRSRSSHSCLLPLLPLLLLRPAAGVMRRIINRSSYQARSEAACSPAEARVLLAEMVMR